MKIFKKIIKAFGGAGLYMDKSMLRHLECLVGDEVCVEFLDDGLLIKKPPIDSTRIQELLNAKIKGRN